MDDDIEYLRELEATIAEWEAEDVFSGDRRYQDMLNQRDAMREKIYKTDD